MFPFFVSCADFEAILAPFSEVIRNRCSPLLLKTAPEWLQNRHKRQENDTFEVGKLYFKLDSYLHNFFTISDFPIQFSIYTSCPIHHVF